MEKKILLVVEDRRERMILTNLLSGDYEVCHAECRRHALVLISTGNVFDLVLISNDINGRKVAELIRRKSPNSHIMTIEAFMHKSESLHEKIIGHVARFFGQNQPLNVPSPVAT